MRCCWREKDYLSMISEIKLTKEFSADDAVAVISQAVPGEM